LAGCDPFVITFRTTKVNEIITIPTQGAGYDVEIDWGANGLITTHSGTTPVISYQYLNPGTYHVSIKGSFPRIYFNNTGNLSNLVSVDHR
jgi:hypothetical protein